MSNSPLLVGVFSGLVALGAACAPGAASDSARLSLVAYSTPREAYAELIRAFRATPAGAGVSFEESYGGSTEQARAVQDGLSADLVALSLESDVASLVAAGMVGPGWSQDDFRGMACGSVVVLVVRRGNPRAIHDWADLLSPGLEVIAPNPLTSGGARWSLLAAYGAQIKLGKTASEANAYLRALLGRVPVQAKSAREALQAFVAGKGDVLLGYENEAITAQQKGEAIDYVVPDATILIENPVALTAQGQRSPRAQQFLEFLRGPAGQRIFGTAGYRPVSPGVAAELSFEQPARLFTVADLGGWPAVDARLFDRHRGLIAELFRARGLAVDGQ